MKLVTERKRREIKHTAKKKKEGENKRPYFSWKAPPPGYGSGQRDLPKFREEQKWWVSRDTPAASGRQLTFNDDVLGRPLLVEGGEAGVLADAHHVLPEVKLLCVEAQQAEPQLPHRLRVPAHLWPAAALDVDTRSGEADALTG